MSGDDEGTADPRSELDSHANMVVLGKNAFIFESTGRTCNVHAYDPSLGSSQGVPIVDGAIAYDCRYTGQTFILIARNALYVPTMENNLIPPFIMREGGLTVNDTAKIHCIEPTVRDHCIIFPSSDLNIPLQLHGIFSYFHSRQPQVKELYDCDKLFITPDASDWNPHCTSFERNERAMLTYDGEMADDNRRTNIPMGTVSDADQVFEMSAVTADSWESHVDECMINGHIALTSACSEPDSLGHGEDSSFAEALSLRAEISKMSGSIGSCDVGNNALCELFDKPREMHISDLQAELETIVNPDVMERVNAILSAIDVDKPKGVDAARLAKLWMISEPLAEKALEQNTQLCRQNADNTLSRHVSTNDRMLGYRRIQSTFFTDTMFATPEAKSTQGNKCCQIFVSDRGYVAIYPMKTQEEFQTALHWFCKQVGVPVTLVADAHKSQTSASVKRFCDQVGTTLRVLEKGTSWANRAELYIGLLKEAVRKDLRQSNCPMVLWDYAMERRALIHNVIPRPLFQNNGLTPHTVTFGTQGDISNVCNFGWYEWVYYRDHGAFPNPREKLGRVLGPLRNEGNEMAQAVLTSKGTVIPRRTLRRLLVSELHSNSEKKKRSIFDDIIRSKLGDSMKMPPKPDPNEQYTPYSDDCEAELLNLPDDNDPVDSTNTAVFEKLVTDRLIHAEIHLPQGEEMKAARVIKRCLDENGELIGTYDDNPMLNSLLYEVEFPDGEIREYSANVIAENMYAQVDANGHTHTLLDAITDFSRNSNAISKEDMYIQTKSGQRRMRKSTIGWDLLVAWKDGSEEWIPLKVLKESHPVEVAEFAVARGIDDKAAFKWWVPFVLRKRDRIISAVTSRVIKNSHKYGVEIPRTIEEAYKLDEKNGNSFWRDAINREMENLKVAFDILKDNQEPPPGFTKASGHLVFDVRMTLERKARWVKDGHKTPQPEWSTYAGVVSRESIRIALTYAALNGLPVCGCDIQNAYLQAPTTEKHYIICGPEFGLENAGKRAIIVQALYGGKSAGADYWRHVRKAMDDMNFKSCQADPDVWYRPGTRDDGTEYWEYVLLYTDDVLAIMTDPEKFIREELDEKFTVKPKSIGPPTQYLGNKVSEVTMENGVRCWSFSSSQYIQNAVNNVESYLSKSGESLPSRTKSPWPSNY